MNKELSDLKKFLKSAGFSSEYNYLLKISEKPAYRGLQLSDEGQSIRHPNSAPYYPSSSLLYPYDQYDDYWSSTEGQIKRLEYLIKADNRVADAFSQAADQVLGLISDFIMKEIKENIRILYSYVSSKTASLNVGIRKYALMDILKKYSEDPDTSQQKFDYAPLVGVASSFYKHYIGYLSLLLGSFFGMFTAEGKIAKALNAAKLFVLCGIFNNMDLGEGYMSAIHLLTAGVFTETFNNLLFAGGMAFISKMVTELQYYKASNIEDGKKRFEYVNSMWDTKFKTKEETEEISDELRSRESFLLRTKNALEETWTWLKDNTKSKDGESLFENIDFGKYVKKLMTKPIPSSESEKESESEKKETEDSEEKNNADSSSLSQAFGAYLQMWDGINNYLKDNIPILPRNYIAQVLVILKNNNWNAVEAAKDSDFWENIIDALMLIIMSAKIIDLAGESHSLMSYAKNIINKSDTKVISKMIEEAFDNLVSAILADLVEVADILVKEADLSNLKGFTEFQNKILALENDINIESYEEWDKLKNMIEQYLD